jgi:hypothetical protein
LLVLPQGESSEPPVCSIVREHNIEASHRYSSSDRTKSRTLLSVEANGRDLSSSKFHVTSNSLQSIDHNTTSSLATSRYLRSNAHSAPEDNSFQTLSGSGANNAQQAATQAQSGWRLSPGTRHPRYKLHDLGPEPRAGPRSHRKEYLQSDSPILPIQTDFKAVTIS